MNEIQIWRITLVTNPEDCNLHCIMCEEHSPYSHYKQNLYNETGQKFRRMSVDWLDKILKEAKELGVKEIIPSTMGEPLLYKDFDKILHLCNQYDLLLNLTTNGTFPKREIQEWANLIIPITIDIKISWNGAVQETAEKIMLGLKFNQTIENLKIFIQIRNSHYQKTNHYCKVSFQVTAMKSNLSELVEIIKLSAELGIDRIKFNQLWTHFYEIKNQSIKESSQSIIQWNEFIQQAISVQETYRKSNGEKIQIEGMIPLGEEDSVEVPFHYNCPFLGKELWILATGEISPCCNPDKKRDSLGDFGNIQNISLEEVLKTEQYLELMSNYKTKAICKTCIMRRNEERKPVN